MSTHAPLAGKTVLLTGGARRVGAAIAGTLHGAGANIVIHCHRSVRDAQTLATQLNTLRAASASTFYPNLIGEITEAHWDDLLGSNLKAPLFLSQAAAPALKRSLARELGPQARVNGIAPGPVMWPADGVADDALQAKIIDRTLLKRAGSAEDVARAALFFAADAPDITGHIMPVDGGRSVSW
jgi:pteridine reductase